MYTLGYILIYDIYILQLNKSKNINIIIHLLLSSTIFKCLLSKQI